QQHVLLHGGPYWEQLLRGEPDVEAAVERGWQRLAPLCDRVKAPATGPTARPRWGRLPWLATLALAAAVLLAVTAWLVVRPGAQRDVLCSCKTNPVRGSRPASDLDDHGAEVASATLLAHWNMPE